MLRLAGPLIGALSNTAGGGLVSALSRLTQKPDAAAPRGSLTRQTDTADRRRGRGRLSGVQPITEV